MKKLLTSTIVLRDDRTGVVHLVGEEKTVEIPPAIVEKIVELYMGR